MTRYQFANKEFEISRPVPKLISFEITDNDGTANTAVPFNPKDIFNIPSSVEVNTFGLPSPVCQTTGWIAGANRLVKVFEIPAGIILEVEECGRFFISRDGKSISKLDATGDFTHLDYEILLGSVITLALAIRGVWSLHASAAMHKNNLVVILGESGEGKSTLAAYLDEMGWHRVSDDILPVTIGENGLKAYPHYPQQKLAADAQPSLHLPEQIQVRSICVLSPVEKEKPPAIYPLAKSEITKALLSHTAGTRLFNSGLLKDHLGFCTSSAAKVAGYRLDYPRRREILPLIREMLEGLC